MKHACVTSLHTPYVIRIRSTGSRFYCCIDVDIWKDSDTLDKVYVKTRSHDPILRIQFLVPKIGKSRSDGPISTFRFCGENVGRSFVCVFTRSDLRFGAKMIIEISCKICRRLSSFKKSVG